MKGRSFFQRNGMGVKSETRSPKSERSSKSEARNLGRVNLMRACCPKQRLVNGAQLVPATPATRRFGFRPSDFFRFSVFGLRIYLEPALHWKCRGTGKRHSGVGCRPNASLRSAGEQLGAVFRGRLAQQLFEDPVEMRERLEPDFKRDLAHAQVGIQQQVLRLLNADA